MELETLNKLYLELSQVATAYTRRDIENAVEIAQYVATLETGVAVLCAAVGVDVDRYDRDQADIACYADCFKEMAELLEKSGWNYDESEGGFSCERYPSSKFKNTEKENG